VGQLEAMPAALPRVVQVLRGSVAALR